MKKEIHDIESQKKELFKVPENYFENFENELFEKIKKSDTTKTRSIKKQIRYISTGIAASLLLCFGLISFFNKDQYTKLSSEILESYLETQTFYISNELEAYLDDEDFTEIEKSIPLNEKEISDYLLTSTDIEFYINN